MFSAVFLFALEQYFLSCLSNLMMKCHFIPLNVFLILACKEYIKFFIWGVVHACVHACCFMNHASTLELELQAVVRCRC